MAKIIREKCVEKERNKQTNKQKKKKKKKKKKPESYKERILLVSERLPHLRKRFGVLFFLSIN